MCEKRYVIYKNNEIVGRYLTFEGLKYIVSGILDNCQEGDDIVELKIGEIEKTESSNNL